MPTFEYFELNKMNKPNIPIAESTINGYWIYAVYDFYKQLKFIWYGRLQDIIANRPIKTIRGYKRTMVYNIYLLQYCATEIDAKNEIGWWLDHSELKGRLPEFNLNFRMYNNDRFIRCVETGELFRNAQEIVSVYGVSQSALSSHLNGRKGYRTVKGRQYEYCDDSVTYKDYEQQRRINNATTLHRDTQDTCQTAAGSQTLGA